MSPSTVDGRSPFPISAALQAALDHRLLENAVANGSGRGFAWRGWHLGIPINGSRVAAEFVSLVAHTLQGLGFWVGRHHSHPTAIWKAARGRLRVECTNGGASVLFYADGRTGLKHCYCNACLSASGDTHCDFFTRARCARAKAAITFTLERAGFVNLTPPSLGALDTALFRQRTSGHWSTDGLRITNPGRDDRDAERKQIVEGSRKAAYCRGRLFVGTAIYDLNSQWCLVAGEHLAHVSHWEMFDPRPGLPARWWSPRQRRDRLRQLLQSAIKAEDFERACILKRARDRVPSDPFALALPATLHAYETSGEVSV